MGSNANRPLNRLIYTEEQRGDRNGEEMAAFRLPVVGRLRGCL